MKVWQVEFPDTKVQVSADGVTQQQAVQVMIDFMSEHINNEIKEHTIVPEGVKAGFSNEEDDADVTQSVEVTG